jgi:hypothetical protein
MGSTCGAAMTEIGGPKNSPEAISNRFIGPVIRHPRS